MCRMTLLLLVSVASIATTPVPLEGSDSGPTQSTHTGWIHNGCVPFEDRDDLISKGPITAVGVCHGGYIHGIRLCYGKYEGDKYEGEGDWNGLRETAGYELKETLWKVPNGERIVRVKGEITGYYISRLQFITTGGNESPWFGQSRGTPFEAADPHGFPLRTISGWVNLKRHPSLNRAVASMTFHFDPSGPVSPKPPVRDPGPTRITRTGWIHRGCVEFRDREDVVNKGPIAEVRVCHGGYIHGIQLCYGKCEGDKCEGEGDWHGLKESPGYGLKETLWKVPNGERIVRVDGEIAKYKDCLYVSRLQFITDKGTRSQWFGENRGTPFEAADPNGLPLTTISGWVNLTRHEALSRAIASMTFHFGPYWPVEDDPAKPEVPADLEGVPDQTKVEYLTRYAPLVWFHPNEEFWPSSVEWSFQFLKRVWLADKWWFVTKETLAEPSSVLDYFHGADPKKLEDVPSYAFWHQVGPDTVDLFYFFYYPYNRGQSVANTRWGNHVGDWEHVTVRLTVKRDKKGRMLLAPLRDTESINLAYHSYDVRYKWAEVPKVQDTEHPIIYSAAHSHGSYLWPGDHKYDEAAGTALVDYTGAGTAWDTWKKLECFDYDTKRGLGPTWMETWPKWLDKDTGDKNLGNEDPASGPVSRWGNYRSGGVRWLWLFGKKYYRLDHGPTGPADKPYFGTTNLD